MVALGNFRVGFAFGMSISCCLSSFHLLWVANTNEVSGGIWAVLKSDMTSQIW